MVSVTHLILRFANVQNKFQQTNKTKINHINDNHIKLEVSLHFGGSGLLCGTPGAPRDDRPDAQLEFILKLLECLQVRRNRKTATIIRDFWFNSIQAKNNNSILLLMSYMNIPHGKEAGCL